MLFDCLGDHLRVARLAAPCSALHGVVRHEDRAARKARPGRHGPSRADSACHAAI